MKEAIIGIGTTIIMGLVIISIAVGIGATAAKMQCDEFAALNSDYEFRWDFLTGCKLKTPKGFWISTSMLRYTNGEITFEEETK